MPSGRAGESPHLVIIGETRGVELREEKGAVFRDFERSGSPGRDLDGCAKLFEQVPRTERTRLVVSEFAVFDLEAHLAYLCAVMLSNI